MTRVFLYILLIVTAAACREKYIFISDVPAAGYLVVEGVINSGNGPTSIKISRTQALEDSNALRHERSATVRVEGEDNSRQQLYEKTNGLYSADQLNINPAVKYRLHIYTNDGREYATEYASPNKTPAIDDITWLRTGKGLELFVNSHDPQNNTKYYRWDYEETWEFHSPYIAQYTWKRNPGGTVIGVDTNSRFEIPKMYTCWASATPNSILVGTTKALVRDSVYLKVIDIPQDSWKISVMYSVNLKQYALTKEGFDFFQRMKKNTEELGTLFDPQPSQLNSNVLCISNPEESVIGFVEIANVEEKRIFIRRSEVAPWTFMEPCEETPIPNNIDSIRLAEVYLLPTTGHVYGMMGELRRFWAARPECVDCRLRGTSEKPSYWP